MKNLNKITHLFLQEIPDLKNKNIMIGYSGGADSTALLDIMADKQSYFQYNLKAVFFSHEGSPLIENEEELIAHCKDFCIKKNVELIIHPLFLTKKIGQSWESSGRHARMEFYEKNKPDMVFLGHHKDDQNETTMIQLFRGAGRGISAMKKIDNLYYRPFLEYSKSDIYDYLNYKKLTWIEDSTNNNIDFTRNFWRKKVLPLLKSHYPAYSQNLDLLREKTTELNSLAKELAIVDGLDKLLKKESVMVDLLSDSRIKNLIQHYFYAHKISLDNNYLSKQLNKYQNDKEVIFEKKDCFLEVKDNVITILNENNLENLKNKKKKL